MVKESAERIQYIADYIASYKIKIEALNKNGLFDTATLYEVFAQGICEIWFGQKFFNLNSTRVNFPCVDLISKDAELYVQVSTKQDVPIKIKETLERIRDSKTNNLQGIKKLYFFVLSNSSINRVKDFSGESRIGNVNFNKAENLITTDIIVQRAKTDSEFQRKLFNFLYGENNSLIKIGDKFEKTIKISKILMNNNIDCLINDEYEIDRTKEITLILEECERFISVQGEAGSGKSALCKKMLEDEEFVLYARAEKISEARKLEDVWGLDIGKVVKYLTQRKLVIYIDALEFIADGAKTKIDLLQEIYETVKEYDNIFVITSCRSCDRTAFIKIENIYNIKKYNISFLSDDQIIKIAQKYKIVQDLWDAKSYVQLLRSPFYLNLIIRKIKDLKKIYDVDSFRNFIWTDVMCLKEKRLLNGVKHSDIRKAIEKIVFDRAKNFLVGIKREKIGEEIVSILESENIITSCADNTIRLKYDIFEDICFERFIDSLYDDCKNDYDVFFSNLEYLGRCIYRRYQIWVENKLFSKENREKFLYKLLEIDKLPENWKTQTIIGIVKSNFCSEFFEEYEHSISRNLLWVFVRLTNNFAFEASILNLKYENVYTKLKPIGMGRPCLINLIYKSGVYKDNKNKNHVLKLCSDYSQAFICNATNDFACRILQFYVEEKMKMFLIEKYCNIAEEINLCLLPIYRMAKNSRGWIKQFWADRIQGYLSNGRANRADEDILKYVLKNTVPALAQFLPKELCEIANTYWIKTPEYDKEDSYYSRSLLGGAKPFGLSRKADLYNSEYRNIYENAFLCTMVQNNCIVALEWIIGLTNYVANSIKVLSPKNVYDISVWESTPQEEKKFICNPDFWLAGIQEHTVHKLISDAIFLFTQMAIREINSKSNTKEIVVRFAEYIKSEILKKANNIIMLSVIAEIGRNCEQIIPGYSLFLASSIDLVILDSQKMMLLMPSPDKQLYENLILMSVGIPKLKDRYNIKMKGNDSLQDYVLKMQLLGGSYKKKAENILDYLYSTIPNQRENAMLHLQIQKMDLRNGTISQVDERTYVFTPEIKGNAKNIVEENSQSKFNIEKNTFQKIINDCNSLMANEKFELQECLNVIKQLQSLIEKSDVPGQLQNRLVMIIAYALAKYEMTSEKRSELCDIWIDGIESIFNNDSFAFEIGLVKVLYKQIEYKIEDVIKERLKRQMLDCLLYRGHQGIISQISDQLKEYLTQNEKLAKSLFNTIIGLSEDRMAYFLYNVSQLNKIGRVIDYKPNRGKPPIWVKDIFKENNIDLYQSKREEIIEKLLLQDSNKDLSNWNIEDCDIQTLCHISNCGLSFRNDDFKFVMEKLFPYVISIISTADHYHEYLDVYAIGEVTYFIKKALIKTDNISQLINMLFDSPDFAKMSSNAYELYEDISYYLLAVFFDAHNNAEVRIRCEKIIKCMEDKINYISDEDARNRLYSMLFLTPGSFHMDDWSEIRTEYSFKDKMFLSDIWSKYGWLHFKNLLYVIYQLHIKDLLPEVVVPLNISLKKLKRNLPRYDRKIKENEIIINEIITKLLLDFNDKIKSDKELTLAFEELLELLVEMDMEEAAVILDEFRVH